MKSLEESRVPGELGGELGGGLAARTLSVVLMLEKPVGFPHETQNLAS